MTFADSPGIFVTFLPTGPQLKEVVFLQAEQTVSINIDYLKYVRQRLPVAEQGQHRKMSEQNSEYSFISQQSEQTSQVIYLQATIHRAATDDTLIQERKYTHTHTH